MTLRARRHAMAASVGALLAAGVAAACGRSDATPRGHANADTNVVDSAAIALAQRRLWVPDRCASLPPIPQLPVVAGGGASGVGAPGVGAPGAGAPSAGASAASAPGSMPRTGDSTAAGRARDSAQQRSVAAATSQPAGAAHTRTSAVAPSGAAGPPTSTDSAAHAATDTSVVAKAPPPFTYAPGLPGSLFPGCRVVAYYGNPLSKRMGILGQVPPDAMLAKLDSQALSFASHDTTRPVLRALELIATVAQASPGKGGLYRLRMPDTLIAKVAKWAESKHYLLILDIQAGRSTVEAELTPLLPYLSRPYVHLALDPEFSVSKRHVPGEIIGRMDAADVNVAVHALAHLVDSLNIPPKMLIVHRFTKTMLSNHQKIELDPRVQVVIDMDGFGAPHLKYSSYAAYVHDRPVQYPGFKLFYKNDKPMLTVQQVLALDPVPVFVMFQ